MVRLVPCLLAFLCFRLVISLSEGAVTVVLAGVPEGERARESRVVGAPSGVRRSGVPVSQG